MTRLLYLPDDATVIQLEVDLSPAELVAVVNAGLRPLPILRTAPAGKLSASQVNATVVIAPLRSPGRPRRNSVNANLTRRQRELLKEFEKEARNNSPESEGFFAKARAFWDGFGN